MQSPTELFQFSDTDLKLLQALLIEQTAQDAAQSVGITYAYAIKRISRLKKRKFISERITNNQHYYQTVRNEETEYLFSQWEETTTPGATKQVFKVFNYYGRTLTIWEAINEEIKRLNELPGQNTLQLVGHTLLTIKHQAFRRLQGLEDQQPPDLKTMRKWLELHLVYLKRVTRIVEEVLNNKKLWADEKPSPALYKWINDKESTEVSGNPYANALYSTWKEHK